MPVLNPGLVAPESLPLADTTPSAEAVAGSPGSMDLASRADHAHKRLTSATTHTLDSNGEATIVFTRTFPAKPTWIPSYEEAADNQPVNLKVKSWTIVGGIYTGCVVKGYRSTILPPLTGIVLVGPLVSALSNLNVFGGSAAGVSISFIALQASA